MVWPAGGLVGGEVDVRSGQVSGERERAGDSLTLFPSKSLDIQSMEHVHLFVLHLVVLLCLQDHLCQQTEQFL